MIQLSPILLAPTPPRPTTSLSSSYKSTPQMKAAAPAHKRAWRNPPTAEHHRVSLGDDYADVQARSSTLRAGLPVDTLRTAIREEVDWDDIDSWEPEDDPDLALDPNSDQFDDDMGATMHEVLDKADAFETSQKLRPSEKKKTRSQASVRMCLEYKVSHSLDVQARPNVFWKTHLRDGYLDELLRADGRGEFRADAVCPDCKARSSEAPSSPEVRCRD